MDALLPKRFDPKIQQEDVYFGSDEHMLLCSRYDATTLAYELRDGRNANTSLANGYSLLHALYFSLPEGEFERGLDLALRYKASPNHCMLGEGLAVGTGCHLLIANEAFEAAEIFLDKTAKSFDPSLVDGEDKTTLIIAAKARGEDVALKALEIHGAEKCNINAQDEDGMTALHYAYALHLPKLAKALEDAGAQLDIQDEAGRMPREYLDCPEEVTRDILISIEIHPDRDANAPRNSVRNHKGTAVLTAQGAEFLATKDETLRICRNTKLLKARARDSILKTLKQKFENAGGSMDGMRVNKNALAQEATLFAAKDIKALRETAMGYAGVSLIDYIMQGRAEMKLTMQQAPSSGISPP